MKTSTVNLAQDPLSDLEYAGIINSALDNAFLVL